MAHKAPGKAFRKGIPLAALTKQYPDDAAAERLFIARRWPDGIACPRCGSCSVLEKTAHPTMPHQCRDCKKFFSVKTRTLMEGSNIGYQAWLIAIYSLLMNLKGTSSVKLHRDLGISQKSAWYMAHRIREAWAESQAPFGGPVEVDETFIGGLESNKHESKKLKAGRGTVGKVPVVGERDQETGQVSAVPVSGTDRRTLQDFVKRNTAEGATVYTDENAAYDGVPFDHETVKHSMKEYVRGRVHTNGVESFWAMFKRGHKGTYHKMSPKHLKRYVTEFVGRHNKRSSDTIDQIGSVIQGMEGKRLSFANLIAPNGLDSGARGRSLKA